MKDDRKKPDAPSQEQGRSTEKPRQEKHLTDDGRESSNGKVTGVEGKDYVILSSGLGIDEDEVTG
ncbi:hypothetical protein [Flaviaesturariibacter aridisoli]|uniref:Uncharacterized protein n=1 Tax=Flaviaesturariibacter aridisoli TaxID=2545761 RepID=A0A4R4DVV7_9BACT|nr:hypothetical protein [Flaviaesturariibacter aridisoli]TCZ67913.1 hypothetical protein E0486_14905 [Flaviaesturariibacter aridisoli]